ncbi:MAG: penicillin-binding protein activator, partial [Candidatus Methylumidiphilus sp.]
TPPPAPPPPAAPAAPTPEPPPAVNNGFVGVLLPLTGQYAIAGQTVRAGLQAASSADTNPNKPELRFVDTQTGNVGALYQTFASQGAKFVIGPLTKEEVTTLGAASDIPVPVLALNQIDGLNRDKLYQFALTPEQEVEQAASLAWFDGRQNALLLAPATALGQRLVTHFTSYWKSLGGKIASVRTYPSGAADYSGTAKQLLAGVSGDSTSQIAPEFIFLIANSNDGRLLNPHIINQQTGKIPIYATSMIFNGQPDAAQNNDLSGVTFCDSPWLLNTDSDPLSRKSMLPTVRQTPELYLRLLPMGIDAYQLSQELGPLKAGLSRYNGATGVLSLRSGNRIQRQLHCAQFDGPTLQPRGIAPTLQPGLTAPTP